MTKAMLIDLTKCMGCYNCVVACMDEHVDNDWSPIAAPQAASPPHYWMQKLLVERGTYPKVKITHIPTPCNQCTDAPCQKAATGGAIYKRADGILIIDPTKSVGQKQLVSACPYGRIYWNDALNIPQKCTFCAHLLDDPTLDSGSQTPRCVTACPVDALTFGEASDLAPAIQANSAVPLHPEYGTTPRVFFVGLPKTFVTGSLVDGKTGDCVSGASVSLTDLSGGTSLTATSDNMGDFWFDGLASNKTYQVKISKAGMFPKTLIAVTTTDRDLGDIVLVGA
jgi:Fe-S-cluster-containing dehydrogenase component